MAWVFKAASASARIPFSRRLGGPPLPLPSRPLRLSNDQIGVDGGRSTVVVSRAVRRPTPEVLTGPPSNRISDVLSSGAAHVCPDSQLDLPSRSPLRTSSKPSHRGCTAAATLSIVGQAANESSGGVPDSYDEYYYLYARPAKEHRSDGITIENGFSHRVLRTAISRSVGPHLRPLAASSLFFPGPDEDGLVFLSDCDKPGQRIRIPTTHPKKDRRHLVTRIISGRYPGGQSGPRRCEPRPLPFSGPGHFMIISGRISNVLTARDRKQVLVEHQSLSTSRPLPSLRGSGEVALAIVPTDASKATTTKLAARAA